MRFVPAHCIREDMVLGKSIYGQNGELLLAAGNVILHKYIKKILELGFNGIYIEDENSKDIEVVNIISEELRLKTVKTIKDVFIGIENTTDRPNSSKIVLQNSIKESRRLILDIIQEIIDNKSVMVNMIDLKLYDDYTFFHSVNTTVLSLVLGVATGLNKDDLTKLGMAALFHDIGKIFIQKDILNKEGKLTDEEFEIMKKHSEFGFKYAKGTFHLPIHVCIGIYQHHEKYDGSGYPEKTVGDKISLFGRIIGLVDSYDALTSDRAFRKALLPSDAMEYIMAASGTLFDPELVFLFTRRVAAYPIGTYVKLSNGEVGIVIENYEDCCLRPRVKIISDILNSEKYYNLKYDADRLNVTIVGIADY